VARWEKGERTVQYLIGRGRLDSFPYFDPAAAPITESDASWAIEKATAAVSGVKALLAATPPGRFS